MKLEKTQNEEEGRGGVRRKTDDGEVHKAEARLKRRKKDEKEHGGKEG